RLGIDRGAGSRELLAFVSTAPSSTEACGQAVEAVVLSGTGRHVPSGTGLSCYQEPKAAFSSSRSIASEPPNLESNEESNFSVVGDTFSRGKSGKGERR
ncbi:MAG TPA: replication protein, partial [Reyranella sp.]|nr:replication protein [Reyranella sp.]